MNNINIDTNKLNVEIEQLKSVNNDFEEIFDSLKKDTEALKDYWSNRTSESVFASFEEFYIALENVKNTFSKDISFLEKVVSSNYELEDKEISTLIDDKMTS